MSKNRGRRLPRMHRTAGLDQLGPTHYMGSGHALPSKRGSKRSISARSKSSTTGRHVQVTLPKFSFTDREDT